MIGNGWEILAKTELTCKGKAITKKGITEKKCKEFAEKKNRNFVWYTPKIGKFQDPELCALYKSCDLKKGGRMPSRPGKTLERNSSGTCHILRFQFCTISMIHFDCIVKSFINVLHL